jgi:hypothetical protein
VNELEQDLGSPLKIDPGRSTGAEGEGICQWDTSGPKDLVAET